MSSVPDLIYLGRSRLHRSRANLIQTFHTLAAFAGLGLRTRLYLPPWRGAITPQDKAEEFGLARPVDVRASRLLDPRGGFHPFVLAHRRALRAAGIVYTRVPEISLALSRAGVSHHLEVHETQPLERTGKMRKLIDTHRGGTLDHLIPITRADARVLVEAGADPRRVHMAPSGVALEAFAHTPRFDPARLDRPRIVYLGRVTPDRGLGIFESLARRTSYPITLVGGEAHDRSNGLTRFPWTPHRCTPQWYARCDLAMMPYQVDLPHARSISPIKLFEAMAAGRPIIASNLPTIREVIEHERTGLLVEPADVAGWIAAVERLRENRALAQGLAERARALAPRYSWTQRVRGILAVIQPGREVLSG